MAKPVVTGSNYIKSILVLKLNYILLILSCVIALLILSCESDAKLADAAKKLDLITIPWNGGDYRLSPLPSNDQNITTRGYYPNNDSVEVKIFPAPGWYLSRVFSADWDGKSDKIVVNMTEDRRIILAFDKSDDSQIKLSKTGIVSHELSVEGDAPKGDSTALPTLILKTISSSQLTLIRWHGFGFTPKSDVGLAYGPNRIAVGSVSADEQGNIEGSFKIPMQTVIPSNNIVTALGDDGTTASANHNIPEPSITVDSSDAVVGSSVIIEGLSFPASTQFSSAMIGSKSILPSPPPVTGSDGRLVLVSIVPDLPKTPSKIKIEVGAATAETYLETFKDPTDPDVIQRLILDYDSKDSSELIKWTGSGFTPGSNVNITYGTNNILVNTTAPNKRGEITGSFEIPDNSFIASENIVRASGDDGKTTTTIHKFNGPMINTGQLLIPSGSKFFITGENFPVSTKVTSVAIGTTDIAFDSLTATDSEGKIKMELKLPNQNIGHYDVVVGVGASVARMKIIIIKTELTLGSTSSGRYSTVSWFGNGFSPGSAINLEYGSDKTLVATGIANKFGQVEGTFAVPPIAGAPSRNTVLATANDGITTSTSHSVLGPTITVGPIKPAVGTRVTISGENFPRSRAVTAITLGSTPISPGRSLKTDARGNLNTQIPIPYLETGQTSLKVEVGSVSAKTNIIISESGSRPIGWHDMKFSETPWAEVSQSGICIGGPCLISGPISNSGTSVMWLDLRHPSDSRHLSYMDLSYLSFEFKLSIDACCAKFSVLNPEQLAGPLLGEWSDDLDWTVAEFKISSIRPTILEWRYTKTSSGSVPNDTVLIRNIRLR